MWLSGGYTRKAVCGFDAVLELVVLSLFLVWGWWLQDLVLWATQAEKREKEKKMSSVLRSLCMKGVTEVDVCSPGKFL